ncbi:CD209 antigen-like protein E [Neodiprion virginianus]|uniref:CD209 antigen-like protein E n=1 Tax=Neodiprion virginianus TaxID=2961670 RepID=UPI001EE6DAC1|nr:CD209 antigen-like protein E [Neodiprion virginianus]
MFKWLFIFHLTCLSVVSVISHHAGSSDGFARVSNLPSGYINYPSLGVAFKVHRERRNWSSAKLVCKNEGGRLAVIDTHEKIGYIKSHKPKFSEVWVGLSREDVHWIATENPESRHTRLPWESNGPDSFGNCAAVNVRGDGLCNKVCIWRKAFACEIPTATAVPYHVPNTV